MVVKLFDNTCPNVLYLNFKTILHNKYKFSSVSSFLLALKELYSLKLFSNLDIFQGKTIADIS